MSPEFDRPTSYQAWQQLIRKDANAYTNCISCGEVFSPSNTISEMGWRETQISGMCETCFDNLFLGE